MESDPLPCTLQMLNKKSSSTIHVILFIYRCKCAVSRPRERPLRCSVPFMFYFVFFGWAERSIEDTSYLCIPSLCHSEYLSITRLMQRLNFFRFVPMTQEISTWDTVPRGMGRGNYHHRSCGYASSLSLAWTRSVPSSA